MRNINSRIVIRIQISLGDQVTGESDLETDESLDYSSGNELRISMNGNRNDFGLATPLGFFGVVKRVHFSESSSKSLQTRLTVAAVINVIKSEIPSTSSSMHFLANLLLMHFCNEKNELKNHN